MNIRGLRLKKNQFSTPINIVFNPFMLKIHFGGQGVRVLHEETSEEEGKGRSSLNFHDLNGELKLQHSFFIFPACMLAMRPGIETYLIQSNIFLPLFFRNVN